MRHKTLLRGVLLVVTLMALISGCSAPAATPLVEATPLPAPSPSPDPWDPFALNARLGRGVNLGNALEAPSEGEWGVVLREEYFALIRIGGFDSVRIPIRWSAHAATLAPYTVDPAFFDRVDWAVEQALSRGLIAVINMHHYEEMFDDPAEEEERFLALWQQIAEHYKDYPPELVFEVLNEPNGALSSSRWNALLEEALAVIREANPTRNVVVGPVNWNNIGALSGLELPEDDRHLIVTFHYYDPFQFTHQGAEWVQGADAWLGTTWQGTEVQKRGVIADLELAAEWGRAHDRPLYMGEFGAYSKADMDSRARWTAFVARTAEERGISWAYWEFCSGFGVFDPTQGTWNEPILEALIPADSDT
jgi:endoglucanase